MRAFDFDTRVTPLSMHRMFQLAQTVGLPVTTRLVSEEDIEFKVSGVIEPREAVSINGRQANPGDTVELSFRLNFQVLSTMSAEVASRYPARCE